MGKTIKKPLTIATISLGCVKNIIDTEVFLGATAQAGFILTPYPEYADIVLVNTCAFIDSAVDESLETLKEIIALQTETGNKPRKVVAVGCLVQRLGNKIFELAPGLAGAVGLDKEKDLPAILKKISKSKKNHPEIIDTDSRGFEETLGPAFGAPECDTPRFRITPKHYSYLRLSEGCNSACTFCIIPTIRGRLRSKPLKKIIEETVELVNSGTRELILVSQDLTAYGTDLYGKPALRKVLSELEEINGIEWIRLLYLHPNKISEDLVDFIAQSNKILPCLDLPFQHASDNILKEMGRKMVKGNVRKLVQRLKENIPSLVIRGTFLVGFPGETEADFQELFHFVNEFRFPRGGVFCWSPQKGSKAFAFRDRVDEETASKRTDIIKELIAESSERFAENRIGDNLRVVVDEERDGYLSARSFSEAPDIDPQVRLPSGCCKPGSFINIKVTGTKGLDIVGQVEEQETKGPRKI